MIIMLVRSVVQISVKVFEWGLHPHSEIAARCFHRYSSGTNILKYPLWARGEKTFQPLERLHLLSAHWEHIWSVYGFQLTS